MPVIMTVHMAQSSNRCCRSQFASSSRRWRRSSVYMSRAITAIHSQQATGSRTRSITAARGRTVTHVRLWWAGVRQVRQAWHRRMNDGARDVDAAGAGARRRRRAKRCARKTAHTARCSCRVTSSHSRPRACTRLLEARASAKRSAAGGPVLSRCSGSVASGLIPFAPSAAMSTKSDALTDHFAPGDRSEWARAARPETFRSVPTMRPWAARSTAGDCRIASLCSALALSSVMSPTDQSPFAMAPGVKPSTMNPRPSSGDSAVGSVAHLECHCELARSFARADRQPSREARAHEVATARFVVLAADLPRGVAIVHLSARRL